MRREFARQLLIEMQDNEDIVVVVGDLGYLMFDQIRSTYPDRFYNVGAAEQVIMDIAVGLSMRGKTVIVYSITPFLLFRGMETIRLYIDHECIPVIMAGSGRGDEYKAGFSHDASDHEILKNFKNIEFVCPEQDFDLKELILKNKPIYLNLKR
jgi:transketolase